MQLKKRNNCVGLCKQFGTRKTYQLYKYYSNEWIKNKTDYFKNSKSLYNHEICGPFLIKTYRVLKSPVQKCGLLLKFRIGFNTFE